MSDAFKTNMSFDLPTTVRTLGVVMDDAVNHPAHYTDGEIEVSDFIADKNFNFFLGNVIKYVSRAGKKNPHKIIEDLEKAQWYLNAEIERLKRAATSY